MLGLLEEEDAGEGKLKQETVVYLKPHQVGDKGGPGCRCGKCFFFHEPTGNCFLTAPPACHAEHGVCVLFMGGAFLGGPAEKMKPTPQGLISKSQTGYLKDNKAVPSFCGRCEHWEGGAEEKGTCSKVAGVLFRDGCCNLYELC